MKIAYLAPEIPSLSATFVYNEILHLEAMGAEIVPFSVHKPLLDIKETRVNSLKQRTRVLYTESKLSVVLDNCILFVMRPLRYLKTLRLLITDIWHVGLLSRTALGLVYRFLFAASLAKQLLKKNCEHIHVHFAHVPTDIAMYAASLSGIPFSVTAHANDLFERGWLLKEKVQRSGFFATISEFNKRYLETKGVNIEKVSIVRCGVDSSQFECRKDFVPNTRAKIGVVGRLVEKKGIDTLIEAIALLKNQDRQIELYIAGSGPLENDLKALAKKNNLSASEIVFLGAIPHTQVASFIKSLDIFVLPCKRDSNGDMDGIPVVLMEAMLSGVPVISTDLSGIPELVINEETGLLIKPDDDEALAEAISNIIDYDNLRNYMIKNAVTLVEDEFSLNKNTNKLNVQFCSVSKGV